MAIFNSYGYVRHSQTLLGRPDTTSSLLSWPSPSASICSPARNHGVSWHLWWIYGGFMVDLWWIDGGLMVAKLRQVTVVEVYISAL